MVVQVPERLAPLIRTIEGVTDVINPAMPLPPFDEQAPLMSLPRILGTTADTIPGNTPYLQADQQLVARLHEALGPAAGLRAGLAWAGNPDHLADRQRSMPLETLKPLGDLQGVEWFSLHIGEKACAEVRQGGWVREILSDSGGVAELAALLLNLDLVISVDSVPAHWRGPWRDRCGRCCPWRPTGAGNWTGTTRRGIPPCGCSGSRSAAIGKKWWHGCAREFRK